MCGIAGKISFGASDVAASDIDMMNRAIAHRGPDGSGIYVSENKKVGLGHRRLSIIDLSDAGSQPMRYMDRYEIVFNGEIYNFQEERQKLERAGYKFSSHTDTEVIMALYDAYGNECVKYLRGMFAFAIYDEKENILFCARDRVGQKPFKYFYDNQTFIFASEIKAILTQMEYKKEIDEEAIIDFLILQYAPGEKTGFKNIKKLLPGHTLTVNLQNNTLTIKKFWDISYDAIKDFSERTWSSRIKTELHQAVEEQMVADVPVGAMLSGGVDSSIIVGLMAQISSKPIETFSVGFKGSKVSELPYAKEIAHRFHTNHHELFLTPAHTDVLTELVRTMEEPFADHGALPTLLISKLMRQHVTVALNGDGGDENFAGYDRYTAFMLSEIANPYASLLHHVRPLIPRKSGDRIRRFIDSLSLPPLRRYLEYVSYVPPTIVGRDSVPEFSHAYNAQANQHVISRLLYTDIHTYLPGALLPKVDMAAMSASLEARSPFFDHRFMEMAATIPPQLKIKGLSARKYILKEAFKDMLPHSIIHRKKQGFSVPLSAWFQKDFFSFTRSILTNESARLSPYISPEYLQQVLYDHQQYATKGRQLWILLMLELWLREFF